MFQRLLNPLKNHSFFLFGPRGVGKTTFLKSFLPPESTFTLDLLQFDLENQLLNRPQHFQEILETLPPSIQWVVVDEVQKIPFLLNEVHRQIELNKKRYFALTGSSTRKLLRGRANLLAGRAFMYTLAPLTYRELGSSFNLDQALSFGTLPEIFSLQEIEGKKIFLKSYGESYLKEEVQMEGFVRNLAAFRRFLPIAAQANGQILNWSNFAQDVGIDAKTIRSYFQILEDTLLGFLLPAYHRSLRKRQKTHPKFYLFDPGIKRAVAGELNLELLPKSYEYGRAFEHFWILEIMRMNSYYQTDFRFSYFATNDIEIDLVIERPGKPLLFVEIKSAERMKDSELRPLASLLQDTKNAEGLCLCRESHQRQVGKILVSPWQESLEAIGF